MAHPLDGVQAKLDRAFEHLDRLDEEVGKFIKSRPHDTVHGPMDGDNWQPGYFVVRRDPPLKLGIIAGDFAHNLRAALDHVIYATASLHRGSPQGTQFPICRREIDYCGPLPNGKPGARDVFLDGLNDEERAVVDGVQPYLWKDPDRISRDPLVLLSNFSNVDKHKVIHTAFGHLISVRAVPLQGDFRIELEPAEPLPKLTDGTYIYRLRVTPIGSAHQADMRVRVTVTYGMAWGRRGLDDGAFRTIHTYVSSVIDRFRRFFD